MNQAFGRWLVRHVARPILTGTAICLASSAMADTAEDYDKGYKQYLSGDVVSAMPLLRRAADAGHAAAQALLGDILDQVDYDEEAVQYYRKSAAQNNADGQFGLGHMLAGGQGVEKNLAEARKLIALAAEQGHKLAINELATAYIRGGLDIPEDARKGGEAVRWIQAAADNGYVPAMEALAKGYQDGSYGLTADRKLAEHWAERLRNTTGVRQGRRVTGSEKK